MKQTHAEGLRSILRSRIARGVFPLVAVLFACALAAPDARAAATTLPEGVELTDLTSPSGTVTTTTSGDWVKPAKNAFDNGTAHNNDDRSIHSGTTVDWQFSVDCQIIACSAVELSAPQRELIGFDNGGKNEDEVHDCCGGCDRHSVRCYGGFR